MPGRFNVEAQVAPQGFHIACRAHEGGQFVLLCPILRCVLSNSELEVSSSHQGLRSRTQETKVPVGGKEEKTIGTTTTATTTSRTVESARMTSQIPSTAVGRWPLCKMTKIQGLQG